MNDYRVKLIAQPNAEALEQQVNSWLSAHPEARITDILYSSAPCHTPGNAGAHVNYSVAIAYHATG